MAKNSVCVECAKGPSPAPSKQQSGNSFRECKNEYDMVAHCMLMNKGQVKACEKVSNFKSCFGFLQNNNLYKLISLVIS